MTTRNAWDGIERKAQSFEDSLRACGKHGRGIAEFDWAGTPLGPLKTWSPALRGLVGTMMASDQPMSLWYGPDLTTVCNDGFAPILGQSGKTALGRPLQDVFEAILPMARAALSGGTGRRDDLALTLTRNGIEEQTFWTLACSPVRDDDGQVAGFLGVATEITDAVRLRRGMDKANNSLAEEVENARITLAAQKATEAGQQVLRHELVHRIKNLLAIVQAIVSQSIRGAASTEAALESVSARLSAFGRAQDLLTSEGGSHARLRQVIDAALAPYRTADRFDLDGPDVSLNAQQSLGLSLALHELATNATKYGALHYPGGRVAISWDVEGEDFSFAWKETGVPSPKSPTRRGFGSKLSEQIVAGYFSGTARSDYEPDGIAYRLTGKLMPDDAVGH